MKFLYCVRLVIWLLRQFWMLLSCAYCRAMRHLDEEAAALAPQDNDAPIDPPPVSYTCPLFISWY